MYLDPKKTYSSVRVRYVNNKTKEMYDMSMPFEAFTETEVSILKLQFQTVVAFAMTQIDESDKQSDEDSTVELESEEIGNEECDE